MKYTIILVCMLLSQFALGEETRVWPDLSTIKHVSKRSATEGDVNNGAAVFLLQSDGIPIGSL